MDNSGHAFPQMQINWDKEGSYVGHNSFSGMTLRQWYTGQALTGLLANGYDYRLGNISSIAMSLADEVIAWEKSGG